MTIECLTVSVEEAGRILGCSRNSAYEAARRGELPTIRLGRKIRVPKAALQRLLENAAGGATPTPMERWS
jgi:excisionase family DNA binding protein